MSTPADLVAFLARLQHEQVPVDVIRETRRMLLDTLGCIISARATEAGGVAADFAGLLGGAGAPAGSAYLNGRLADAMDFNEGCVGAHFGSGCVAAALALGRQPGMSGKDLLLALAAGYELGGRIQEAIGPYYTTVGGRQQFGRVWGIATPIVYAAAGAAAKLLRLDEALTLQAWALAGSNSPIPVGAKWSSSVDLPNTKYCDAGWCGLAGVTAALSARFGSTGITSLLDDEDGLLRMVSATAPAHPRLFTELGSRWCIREIVYKEWPCCGLLEGPMHLLRGLMREHGIEANAIERIEVDVGSAILVPRFVQPQPRTFASLQFNLPHALAMIALEVPPGPNWLSVEFARRPRVAALRRKVSVGEHRQPWPAQGRRRSSSVRIVADGHVWFSETCASQGDTTPEPFEVPWDDDRITRKFRSLVHPADAPAIVDAVMNLHEMDSPLRLLRAFEAARPVQ